MTNTTKSLADPAGMPTTPDALSQALTAMRITGSLLLRERYRAPWAIAVPHTDVLNTLLNTDTAARVAAFHMVEQGHLQIRLENGNSTRVDAGEMVICFSGLEHRIYQGNPRRVHSFEEIMAGAATIVISDDEHPDSAAQVVCGVFILHDSLLNPLFAALPEILQLGISGSDDFTRLHAVINLLTEDIQHRTTGTDFVIERYLEILCAEAIRSYIDTIPERTTGWLSALRDPVVGRAIEVIHMRPGYNWTVKELAEEVSMSPSRFAARFTATLGESPMAYVAKWRMSIASKMLETSQLSIDQVANSVGYENLAAFSRAFKRHVGLPPAAWRTQSRCA